MSDSQLLQPGPQRGVLETGLKASGIGESSWQSQKEEGTKAVCTQMERGEYISVVCVDALSPLATVCKDLTVQVPPWCLTSGTQY